MDPLTQGQQAPAENGDGINAAGDQNGANAPSNGGVPENIQKRFDEMTAQRHEAERRAAELEGRLQALQQQQMAQLMAMQQAQQVQPQGPNIDPERRAELEAILNPITQRFEQQMARMQSLFGGQIVGMKVAAAAQPYGSAVAQRASQLVEQYAAQGTVLDPDIAVKLAYAEVNMAAAGQGQLSEVQRQNLNQVAAVNVGGARASAPSQPGPAVVDESVVASWSLEKQMAYYGQFIDPNAPLNNS